MRVEIGDEVVVCLNSDKPKLEFGVVTDIHKELAWLNGMHKDEDCYFTAYLYPARVKDELLVILQHRAGLKQAFEDSMKLIYEFNNAISRGEK